MELRTETREIGGISVTCTQFAPIRSLGLMGRLARAGAPAFAAATGINMRSDAAELIRPLGAMFARLEPSELQELAREVLAGCAAVVVKGEKKERVELSSDDGINRAFAGNVIAMFAAMKFAIEVNYENFFDAARAWWKEFGASDEDETKESSSD